MSSDLDNITLVVDGENELQMLASPRVLPSTTGPDHPAFCRTIWTAYFDEPYCTLCGGGPKVGDRCTWVAGAWHVYWRDGSYVLSDSTNS